MTGPGGLTLTQIHTQVKLSTARDQREIAQNKFASTPTRWQRYPLRLEWEKRKNMRAVLMNAPDVLPLDRSAETHRRIEAGHT